MKKLFFLIISSLFLLWASRSFAQVTSPSTENSSFLNYKKWATCIAGVCGLKWVKTYKEWWFIKQIDNYGPAQDGWIDGNGKPVILQEQIKTALSNSQVIRKLISFGPGWFEFKGKKVGSFEVREFQWFGCWWGSYEQQVFDSKGKKQNPKIIINLGDISYTSSANYYSNYSAAGMINSLLQNKSTPLSNTSTLSNLFDYQDKLIGKGTFTHWYNYTNQWSSFNSNQSAQEKKQIEQQIVDQFNNSIKWKSLLFFKKPSADQLGHIPVYFFATDTNKLVHKFTINQEPLMKDTFAEFFALQKFYISNKLDNKQVKNGQLTDFDITRKILEHYISKDNLAVLLGNNAQYTDLGWISSLDQLSEYERLKLIKKYMPLFKVATMWDYHVFIPNSKAFSLQVTAEMCKPLVYIYDKDSKSNSLTITWIWLNFTKLIPSFNGLDSTYTWSYDLINNKAVVAGKTFDYLYYSVKVPHYQFQNNAVYIPGKEMNQFFSDYLPYIGFNTQEQKDFIDYRSDSIDNQKHYAVSIKYNEEIDTYAKLTFLAPYKVTNRVLFEFRELEWIDHRNDWKLYNTNVLKKLWIIRKLTRNPENEVFERGGVYRDLYWKMSVY